MREPVKNFMYKLARLSAEGRFQTLAILFIAIVVFALGCLGVQYLLVGDWNPWRIIELLLDPGAFVGSDAEVLPIGFQLLITLFGVVFFTATLINVVANFFDSVINDYRKGIERPPFKNHTLILGANSMLDNIIRSINQSGGTKSSKIIIVTSGDAEELRNRLVTTFGKSAMGRISVMRGRREMLSELQQLSVSLACSIYILGEDDEPNHDSKSLRCYRHLQTLCAGVKRRRIECIVVLNQTSSSHILQYEQTTDENSPIKTTYINAVENHAQRLLVSRKFRLLDNTLYPALYRDGITAESECGVHFVVTGMTPIAFAVATTAAQICHFPNFVTKGVRTKISLVAPNISHDMEYFIDRYAHLFALSHYKLISWDAEGQRREQTFEPKAEYGDFLDIEWEFIDANIESLHVRDWLSTCAEADTKSEYLSLAICGDDAVQNVASSLYLPQLLYERNIPIFVYQPIYGEVLQRAHNTMRYANVYPFGMRSDCFDPTLQARLQVAKRVNALYATLLGQTPDEERLWDSLNYTLRRANLWAANSVEVKLCSVVTNLDDEVELLAEVEHNRWNIERLLMGFTSLSRAEREEYNAIVNTAEEERTEAQREQLARFRLAKKRDFIHYDIVPYDCLSDSSKDIDRQFIKNIHLLVK